MSATVYYDNADEAIAVTPVTFTNASGTITDPTSVTCVVTDPQGNTTQYTYSAGSSGFNTIVKLSTGDYSLTLTGLTLGGLYNFVWIGTGTNLSQVTPGTFRVVPLSQVGAGMGQWYCGREELKSRLGITDSNSDYEIQLAIQATTNMINDHCGQHFYQLSETRTYQPTNIWELEIDPLVSDSSINNASTVQVNLDYEGNGVYDVSWTLGTNYVFKLDPRLYNINAFGVPLPWKRLQVITGAGDTEPAGGGWLPFIWPFTNLNRVQIIGTWGWNLIPPAVNQAALILATDIFKSKDVAWGVAGMSDLGVVRVKESPLACQLLWPYRNMNRVVGV